MILDYSALAARLDVLPTSRPQGSDCRLNSVCLLLFERPETHILAIQKAASEDYPWSGDIALPGGGVDPADATLTHTALRELHEELGIAPRDVSTCGLLGHFRTTQSQQELAVVVGRWRHAAPLKANPTEVASVVELPLSTLLEHHQSRGFSGAASSLFAPRELTYPTDRVEIWGVTARIIHALLERLLAISDAGN